MVLDLGEMPDVSSLTYRTVKSALNFHPLDGDILNF